jgi:hypothetical protein
MVVPQTELEAAVRVDAFRFLRQRICSWDQLEPLAEAALFGAAQVQFGSLPPDKSSVDYRQSQTSTDSF